MAQSTQLEKDNQLCIIKS